MPKPNTKIYSAQTDSKPEVYTGPTKDSQKKRAGKRKNHLMNSCK